ncbi:MAG: hypothetical protein MUC88_04055 [Planctomycetes bacterium]|jgi:hypothetical protein|nr:hypothetical protein [Planctomycetota bacterium]
MKKVLWIVGLAAAAWLVSGCLVVYEEYRAPRHPHVIYGPPAGVVEVIPAPPPPYWHRHHYRHY